MRLKYNKEDDVLVVQFSNNKIDDAFEASNMLVHVSADKEPVLIEIFKASDFLSRASKTLPKAMKKNLFTPAH